VLREDRAERQARAARTCRRVTYDVSAWSARQRDTNTILHESLALDHGRTATRRSRS
jgi:hypothetical protein